MDSISSDKFQQDGKNELLEELHGHADEVLSALPPPSRRIRIRGLHSEFQRHKVTAKPWESYLEVVLSSCLHQHIIIHWANPTLETDKPSSHWSTEVLVQILSHSTLQIRPLQSIYPCILDTCTGLTELDFYFDDGWMEGSLDWID